MGGAKRSRLAAVERAGAPLVGVLDEDLDGVATKRRGPFEGSREPAGDRNVDAERRLPGRRRWRGRRPAPCR